MDKDFWETLRESVDLTQAWGHEFLAQWSAFGEMHRGPDRVTAIIGGVIVDESLRTLISSQLKAASSVCERLLDGPLRHFSQRVQFAHSLGLFGPKNRRDMVLIGNIRNQFAHKAYIPDTGGRLALVSFTWKEVSDLCQELWWPQSQYSKGHEILKDPKNRFTMTVVSIACRMWNVQHHGKMQLAD